MAESAPADDLSDDSLGRDDKKDKRTSRACLNCRKRKSACHLPNINGVDITPCQRCKATGQTCIIGGSNRGGRRVRRKTTTDQDTSAAPRLTSDDPSAVHDASLHSVDETAFDLTGSSAQMMQATAPLSIDPALQPGESAADVYGLPIPTRESSAGPGISFNDLQNPSDALGILAQIASNGDAASSYVASRHGQYGAQIAVAYPLVRDGHLSAAKIGHLLQRYRQFYHPYFPIIPAASLDVSNLAKTARDEPHLLTAILVLASRDLLDEPAIFRLCSEHMKSLVSTLAAGGPAGIEAVEALLVLAEWTPYTSRSDAGSVGRGEEDREAWMHVGTALRIGYFLGLDRYSFAVRGDDVKDPQWQRKRLLWTACYISDRQISIRLGRAFWSRGPGPLTTLRKEDFPMLAPATPGGEDFASIFQATLELTLLFSNVHDVLYSNPGNRMRSHLSGGYIKYIDDFRSAIYGWKSVWGTLTCSSNLKAALLMSYDYLRLYTNAFAFHATVKRALPQVKDQGSRESSNPSPGRVFYNNVGAVGDARFIYEGLDAAKSLLNMVNTFVDPEGSLRFMPLRFHLYSIYSGVFLYRARCVGVLAADEEVSVRAMVRETVNRLERSGLGPQHPGSRYSQLLRLLWDKVERRERKAGASSTATLANPYRPTSGDNDVAAAAAAASASSSSAAAPGPPTAILPNESPVVSEMMGDFSWTDLDAIGNFAVNGNAGMNIGEAEWWSGFLPAEPNFLYDPLLGMDGWDLPTMQ